MYICTVYVYCLYTYIRNKYIYCNNYTFFLSLSGFFFERICMLLGMF